MKKLFNNYKYDKLREVAPIFDQIASESLVSYGFANLKYCQMQSITYEIKSNNFRRNT